VRPDQVRIVWTSTWVLHVEGHGSPIEDDRRAIERLPPVGIAADTVFVANLARRRAGNVDGGVEGWMAETVGARRGGIDGGHDSGGIISGGADMPRTRVAENDATGVAPAVTRGDEEIEMIDARSRARNVSDLNSGGLGVRRDRPEKESRNDN